MTDAKSTEVLFLGLNDAGKRIYEWLCSRDDTRVLALITTYEQLDLVHQLKPSLIVSVGYGYKIPEDVLSVPELGCVNMHPAYLPYNRGKDPAIWSIVDDTPAGVTLHYMDESLDTGDVIERRRVEKYPDDTGKDLHSRLEEAEFELFTENWDAVRSGAADIMSQDRSDGTFNKGSEFDELCELNLNEQIRVGELIDRLRALTYPPYSNAYFEVDGQRYYVDIEIEPGDD